MKVVYIEWEDASSSMGWNKPDKDATCMIRSCGLLINRTKKATTISTCQSKGGNFIDQMNIPATQIRKFKVLKNLPD